jgi:hypothetical protein
LTSPHLQCTLQELETHWSLPDLFEAHQCLDEIEEMRDLETP